MCEAWPISALRPIRIGHAMLARGILLSIIPLLFCAALLIALHVYSFRHVFVWPRLGKVLLATISVPFIEETFFRGIVLGILLRTGRKLLSVVAVSALFAAVHFLKGSEREPAIVTWTSGFNSIGDAFAGFGDPMMVLRRICDAISDRLYSC